MGEPKVIQPGTVDDVVSGLSSLFNLMNITEAYIPSLIAEGVKESHPELARTIESAKIFMASNADNDIKNQSFTVTQIGEMLDPVLSAIKVNKLLLAMGYQDKLKKRWILTEEGKNYGVIIATTKKGKKDNVEQIRWKKEIIDKINEYLEE